MRFPTISCLTAALAATIPAAAAAASAGSLTTLYTFTGGADGAGGDNLAPGPHGSLVGTVTFGGTSGYGLAYQLTPPAKGGTNWTFSLLHTFTEGADGGWPDQLLADKSGNLFGETTLGGSGPCHIQSLQGCGLVFELSPPAKGQSAWTETVLYNFQGGTDGFYPQDGLVEDANGNLFGTTLQSSACGYNGCGTVFELSPPSQGQTTWTKATLFTFDDENQGRDPYLSLTIDKSGNLYGITKGGGKYKNQPCQRYGCGTAYMLSPPVNGGTAWTENTIWRFSGTDGYVPATSLTLDKVGNVFGLTNSGGIDADCPSSYGCGVLYKLKPPAHGHAAWSRSLPWEFTNGVDGSYPAGAGLTPFHDKYITTTSGDEATTYGSIDMFTPGHGHGHGQWKEDTLFTFTGDANGENSSGPLLERNGTFYGLTAGGAGPNGSPVSGTIYSFKP